MADIYQNEFADLENDFNNQQPQGNNPFGQSITRELLQQSKKELAEELEQEEFLPQKGKKHLEIEIDENEDYEAQNNQAQMNLNDKLMKMEHENFEHDEVEEIVEADLIEEFDALYQADPELQQILGEYPERYTIEEKLSIIQAYKKGGGVQGLAEIIDDEEDGDDPQIGAQGGQGGNRHSNPGGEEEEEEDVDIDLDDPEDVKIIE